MGRVKLSDGQRAVSSRIQSPRQDEYTNSSETSHTGTYKFPQLDVIIKVLDKAGLLNSEFSDKLTTLIQQFFADAIKGEEFIVELTKLLLNKQVVIRLVSAIAGDNPTVKSLLSLMVQQEKT